VKLQYNNKKLFSLGRDFYADNGYIRLCGVDDLVVDFKKEIAQLFDVSVENLGDLLDSGKIIEFFNQNKRKQISKIKTTKEFQAKILNKLSPFLTQLIGPIVHTSSTFHGQFKWGNSLPVDHGGYGENSEYLEVHGRYLLHQDFTGATIPTSPSGVTLWIPLNKCSDWNLRLYPKSHRLGLLCNHWLQLDDPNLEKLEPPVDIQAEPGEAILFNALLLHGTSNPGPTHRISCDIRFFPLCGYLPSEPDILNDNPQEFILEQKRLTTQDTLLAPLLETETFLGKDIALIEPERFSALHWVLYEKASLENNRAMAGKALQMMTNQSLTQETHLDYLRKYFDKPIYTDALIKLLESRFEAENIREIVEKIKEVKNVTFAK
jgi:hypothetical protein